MLEQNIIKKNEIFICNRKSVMNNITINSNSNDIKEMEKLFPRAPLKIIAMEGCKELGQKVNDYIVNFRQSSYREELKSPM